MTTLTVLIATCDRPALLDLTLRSVIASAAAASPGVETRILVIDDSLEGTAATVAGLHPVTYLRNPVHVGGRSPSSARAWGLGQIETEFLELFDDDDVMLPEHVGTIGHAVNAGLDVCATGFWVAYPDPADPERLIPRRERRLRAPHLGDMLVGHQSVNDQAFVRVSAARSVQWDPLRENTMMYHVWLQLMIAGRRFGRTGRATFLYRQHPTSVSHTLEPTDQVLRRRLLADAREAALVRLGAVPTPSMAVRARLVVSPWISALRGRAVRQHPG